MGDDHSELRSAEEFMRPETDSSIENKREELIKNWGHDLAHLFSKTRLMNVPSREATHRDFIRQLVEEVELLHLNGLKDKIGL